MNRWLDHLFIFATIALAISSQLIMRWQVSRAGPFPDLWLEKAAFIFRLLLTPWVITAMVCTFFSGISWLIAMTKFEISYAYPWMSLNYVLVMSLGALLLGESLGPNKILGTLLIMGGIIVLTRT
ncbi:MAG: EamA family transporter [Candidatus Adiutrix sp.]|nr:EamA family transporter [Candidatus Adiutrix sp.]